MVLAGVKPDLAVVLLLPNVENQLVQSAVRRLTTREAVARGDFAISGVEAASKIDRLADADYLMPPCNQVGAFGLGGVLEAELTDFAIAECAKDGCRSANGGSNTAPYELS